MAYPNSNRFFDDKAELAKSLENKLFFAGEAAKTDETSIGYVHGAMATSAKTVRELLTTVNKFTKQ